MTASIIWLSPSRYYTQSRRFAAGGADTARTVVGMHAAVPWQQQDGIHIGWMAAADAASESCTRTWLLAVLEDDVR